MKLAERRFELDVELYEEKLWYFELESVYGNAHRRMSLPLVSGRSFMVAHHFVDTPTSE